MIGSKDISFRLPWPQNGEEKGAAPVWSCQGGLWNDRRGRTSGAGETLQLSAYRFLCLYVELFLSFLSGLKCMLRHCLMRNCSNLLSFLALFHLDEVYNVNTPPIFVLILGKAVALGAIKKNLKIAWVRVGQCAVCLREKKMANRPSNPPPRDRQGKKEFNVSLMPKMSFFCL